MTPSQWTVHLANCISHYDAHRIRANLLRGPHQILYWVSDFLFMGEISIPSLEITGLGGAVYSSSVYRPTVAKFPTPTATCEATNCNFSADGLPSSHLEYVPLYRCAVNREYSLTISTRNCKLTRDPHYRGHRAAPIWKIDRVPLDGP